MSSSNRMNLLNDSDGSGDDEREHPQERLTINKSFAAKLRQKELLQAKALLDDDDDESDSEDEDDDGELVSPELDIQIVKTINSIRKRDPKIYDKNAKWFKEEKGDGDEDDDDEDEYGDDGLKRKRKAYKDVLREQLLTHGADIEDPDAAAGNAAAMPRSRKALAYDAEQEQIRREFIKSAGGSDGDGDDDDDDDGDDILRVRVKTDAERAEEERELQAALKEMVSLGSKEAKEETEKRDAFLLDYISQQKWKAEHFETTGQSDDDDNDNDDDVGGEGGGREGDDDYEKEEEELDNVDLFESKYNFRFEELQGRPRGDGNDGGGDDGPGALRSLQVMGHARNVDGSVRRIDDKRKAQRESRKERKDKERRQKEAELKRLKSLKKQELQSRLKKIGEVGGLKELGLDESILDEDWDAEKYEAMMQRQYGDDYYGQGAEDDDAFLPGADGDGDGDGVGAGAGAYGGEEEGGDYEEGGEEDDDDDDAPSARPRKGANAAAAGAAGNGGQAGMLDELYKLDYEDIVAGMPCRFKYRQVAKEDYGLTTEEILQAEDAELNQFVSLKKISAYREGGMARAIRTRWRRSGSGCGRRCGSACWRSRRLRRPRASSSKAWTAARKEVVVAVVVVAAVAAAAVAALMTECWGRSDPMATARKRRLRMTGRRTARRSGGGGRRPRPRRQPRSPTVATVATTTAAAVKKPPLLWCRPPLRRRKMARARTRAGSRTARTRRAAR